MRTFYYPLAVSFLSGGVEETSCPPEIRLSNLPFMKDILPNELFSPILKTESSLLIFPRFCGHGVKQLALISRTQLEFYSREKSAVADGYRKSQGSRKYRLWPQLDFGIYDDERAPF